MNTVLLRDCKVNQLVNFNSRLTVDASYKIVGWAKTQPQNVVLEAPNGKRIVRHQDEQVVLCANLLLS